MGYSVSTTLKHGASIMESETPQPTANTSETCSTEDDDLEQLLDTHAETYARVTMRYIAGKITEDERDKEFHHSDLKTKHALEARDARRDRETRLDELYTVLHGTGGQSDARWTYENVKHRAKQLAQEKQ
jgi:hypothetical protein